VTDRRRRRMADHSRLACAASLLVARG